MSAHTPGPWDVPNKSVKIRGCNFLATVHWDDDEAEANARLIAAAPDLLAALEAVTACLRGFHAADDFGPLDDEAIDAALDAIAKAVQS